MDDAGKNFIGYLIPPQGRGPQGRRVSQLFEGPSVGAQNTVGVVLGGDLYVRARVVADGLRPSKSWRALHGSGQCLRAENELELDAAMASS